MGVLGGRVVVVTGASSGIGRAIARRVAAEGAAVVAVPHVVPIPPGPGRVVVDTLEGLSPAGLARLVGLPRTVAS